MFGGQQTEGQMLQIVLFYLFVNCPFPTCKCYVAVEVGRKPNFFFKYQKRLHV